MKRGDFEVWTNKVLTQQPRWEIKGSINWNATFSLAMFHVLIFHWVQAARAGLNLCRVFFFVCFFRKGLKFVVADRGGVRLRALAGQPAEDAPLWHLQAGGDWWDPGQRGWQPGHVGLHVTQQLLQLVQHCHDNNKSVYKDLFHVRSEIYAQASAPHCCCLIIWLFRKIF